MLIVNQKCHIVNTSQKQMIFNETHRRLLSHPEKWKLVSSIFPPDHRPVSDNTHEEWLKTNSDSHRTKEILFVLKGHTVSSLNRLIFPATVGTIFLYDSYERHDRVYPREIDNIVHLWLYFVPCRIIARLLPVNKGRIEYDRRVLILENAELYNTFIQEWGDLRNSPLDTNLRRMKLRSLLSLLFLNLIELDLVSEKAECDGKKHHAKIIRMVLQHISDTSGSGVTIDGLAKIAGYSKFHFQRFSKKHTGQKVHDCINVARLTRTEEMLRGGCLHKEISEKLGFSCPSAFSNWYRQRKNEKYPK